MKRPVTRPRQRAVAEPTLRTYKLDRHDGTTEVIHAHVHDAGQTKPGHLTMYLVDSKGNLRPLVTYNVHAWMKVSDISDASELSGGGNVPGNDTPQ